MAKSEGKKTRQGKVDEGGTEGGREGGNLVEVPLCVADQELDEETRE